MLERLGQALAVPDGELADAVLEDAQREGGDRGKAAPATPARWRRAEREQAVFEAETPSEAQNDDAENKEQAARRGFHDLTT